MGYQEERAVEQAKYAGRVVHIECYSHDGLNDYGTLLWDAEKAEIVRGPGYMDSCPLVVDGPAWVVAFYNIATSIAMTAAREERAAREAASEAAREARVPSRGRLVEVVRGRKVKKGTQARVFWYGETQYGWRVGLEIGSERVFVDARNVEVVTVAAQEAA